MFSKISETSLRKERSGKHQAILSSGKRYYTNRNQWLHERIKTQVTGISYVSWLKLLWCLIEPCWCLKIYSFRKCFLCLARIHTQTLTNRVTYPYLVKQIFLRSTQKARAKTLHMPAFWSHMGFLSVNSIIGHGCFWRNKKLH